MKKVFLIIIVIIAATVIFSKNVNENNSSAYSYTGIKNIKTSMVIINIEVIGSDRRDVELEYVNIPDEIKLEVEKKGDTLSIVSNYKKKWFNGINLSKFKLIVYAPESTDLNLESVAGKISVRGINGQVITSTTAGKQSFENLTGVIKATTTAGDINGTNITLYGDSDFETTAGNIRIDFKNSLDDISFDMKAVVGEIEVNNNSKGREYSNSSGLYRLNTKSVFGNQEIKTSNLLTL